MNKCIQILFLNKKVQFIVIEGWHLLFKFSLLLGIVIFYSELLGTEIVETF